MTQNAGVIEHNKDIFVKVPSKQKQQLRKSSTRSDVSNYKDIAMDSSDIYTTPSSSKKCETKTYHKVSREAKVKVSSKRKDQIKKQSTDSVLLNYRLNSSNTQMASSTSNESESEMNKKILEVFRQAKEIIEHYSHQVNKM